MSGRSRLAIIVRGEWIIRVSTSFIFVTTLKTWKLFTSLTSICLGTETHISGTFYFLCNMMESRPDIRLFEHCIDPSLYLIGRPGRYICKHS